MDTTDPAALKNCGLPSYLCRRLEALGLSVVGAGGCDLSGSTLGSEGWLCRGSTDAPNASRDTEAVNR